MARLRSEPDDDGVMPARLAKFRDRDWPGLEGVVAYRLWREERMAWFAARGLDGRQIGRDQWRAILRRWSR